MEYQDLIEVLNMENFSQASNVHNIWNTNIGVRIPQIVRYLYI